MSEKESLTNETVGIDDLRESGELPGAARRKNIPILMHLQGENVGRKHLLQRPETLIGRSLECDIQLSDFEASRRHSVIAYENISRPAEPPRCVIRDLNSKNGTLVNGERVSAHTLRDKDIIAIGGTVLGFYLKDEVEARFDAELYSLATVDPLTGVFNKYYFHREFQRELRRAERAKAPLCLLFCDLDLFKAVNDTHGHLAGDFILRKLGEILLGNVREYDICCRYGGEEFAVVMPSTTLEGARQVAERLRSIVESSAFEYQGRLIRITISIGLAPWLEGMRSVEDLIQAADKTLYRAKREGRNRVVAASDPPPSP